LASASTSGVWPGLGLGLGLGLGSELGLAGGLLSTGAPGAEGVSGVKGFSVSLGLSVIPGDGFGTSGILVDSSGESLWSCDSIWHEARANTIMKTRIIIATGAFFIVIPPTLFCVLTGCDS